ncbi:MAG: FecR family protein [Nitrospiraceae bacterium]
MDRARNQGERHSTPEHDDALRQEAVVWLARLSDRDATAEDRQEFERWRAQSQDHAQVYDKLARVWAEPALDSAAACVARYASAATDRSIAGSRRWTRRVLVVAACFAVLLMAVTYFDLIARFQAEYRTEVGERRTVGLPDHSFVTMNTHTAIATSFDQSVRRVRLLKGEAFFRVHHEPDRPFMVESEQSTTRAIGTEFAVRTQRGIDRVTVIEGVVEVTAGQKISSTARLVAGTMIETDQSGLGTTQAVDVTAAAAWLQGLLIVDGVPLTHVIEEVQRYYPGTILVWNRHFGEMRVTGTYKLEEPSKILYHLTKTFPLRSVGLANRVVVLF